MTLSVKFLTRTNVVLKHMLSWQIWALGSLNSICILPPLADVNLSLDFLKYLEGMIPSWMQLRSAPESIKAMTSNSKSLLMTILTLECHLWKLILVIASKNKSLMGFWMWFVLRSTIWSTLLSEEPSSLFWQEVFSKDWVFWKACRCCFKVPISSLVSLVSLWRSSILTSFLGRRDPL